MMKDKKGAVMIVVAIIFIAFALILFILSMPFVSEIINNTASVSGGATSFLVKAIPWAVLALIIFATIRLLSGGGNE